LFNISILWNKLNAKLITSVILLLAPFKSLGHMMKAVTAALKKKQYQTLRVGALLGIAADNR